MLQYTLWIEDKNGITDAATLLCVHDVDAMEQVKQMLMPVVALLPGVSLFRSASYRNAYHLQDNQTRKQITYVIQQSKL